jgi:polar amino acid transport system substrate-binding protein
MRRLALASAALTLLVLLAGCQFPQDPEGTLDRVRGGTLRVGVIDSPPWAETTAGEPRGVEVRLIESFAVSQDAEIEWYEGSESELVEAMTGFQLDVVIGGLTRSSPWMKEVALTRPYLDTEIEIGLPPGVALPDALGGEEVWVERGSPAAALLKQEEDDAIPLYYEELSEVDGLVLTESYEIEAMGYDRSDHILRDDEHAMAVPMGENAFMIELEDFLLDHDEEAEAILDEEAAR